MDVVIGRFPPPLEIARPVVLMSTLQPVINGPVQALMRPERKAGRSDEADEGADCGRRGGAVVKERPCRRDARRAGDADWHVEERALRAFQVEGGSAASTARRNYAHRDRK